LGLVVLIDCSATVVPKRNPEHAAARSKAQHAGAPNPRWMKAAVEGSGMSGEMVEQMIRSSCRGVSPAISRAFRAASMEREDVVSFGPAWRRSLIPVRSVIHWSEVSTNFSILAHGFPASESEALAGARGFPSVLSMSVAGRP